MICGQHGTHGTRTVVGGNVPGGTRWQLHGNLLRGASVYTGALPLPAVAIRIP